MNRLLYLLLLGCLAAAGGPMPPPGSPDRLTDWRWLARPPLGQRTTLGGQEALPPATAAGQYLLLAVDGPGVLDHLVVEDPAASLTITVDGQALWTGTVQQLGNPPADTPVLFPAPVAHPGGLLAPIGFRASLRIVTDKPAPSRYLSYRTGAELAAVLPAEADPAGAYARDLQAAARAWNVPGDTYRATVSGPAREERASFTLPARSRVAALSLAGEGEVTHLELEFAPALMGALREVVVEFTYDGAGEPSLRLPVTDLTGMTFPWPQSRWDTRAGSLASGVRYPVHVENFTVILPHSLFYCNLPLPFANGLRVELVNRSVRRAFSGTVRATVVPAPDSATAGRLCGRRAGAPVTSGMASPLVTLPGPGQLAGLGFFGTGNRNQNPPGAASWVAIDGAPPLRSPSLLPLWSIWPWQTTPILMHPRRGANMVGAMRHFLTDPLPFARGLAFGYDPGTDLAAAPRQAMIVALWYRFGGPSYAAPPLPDQAEPLPHETFAVPAPSRTARLDRVLEAEELAPLASVHGGEAVAIDDEEQIYHPSNGRYLRVRLDRLLDHADCRVALPASRYFAIGVVGLTGPVNGVSHSAFDLEVLSRQAALVPPAAATPAQGTTWSVLGGAPMNAQLFIPGPPGYRRDGSAEHIGPWLNPAPGGDGVFRITRRGPGATIIRLDQFGLFVPPPTAPGWLEGEEATVTVEGELRAQLPRRGRLEWSGWGALELTSLRGGTAACSWLAAATGPAHPRELVLTGSLAPDGGRWQVQLPGSTAPAVPLAPGQDPGQALTWCLPVSGLTLPGALTVLIACLPPETGTPSKPATLQLDACRVE